ncbi:hypothetical protein ABEF95_007882 [Exophiala dermatitidis]
MEPEPEPEPTPTPTPSHGTRPNAAGTLTGTGTLPGSRTSTGTSTASPSGTGTFTLLLFASASTYADNLETMVLPAPTTLRAVFRLLETKFPGFTEKVLKSSAVTVNLEYADSLDPADLDVQRDLGLNHDRRGGDGGDEDGRGQGLDLVIRPGDEVGIIPPVSSG